MGAGKVGGQRLQRFQAMTSIYAVINDVVAQEVLQEWTAIQQVGFFQVVVDSKLGPRLIGGNKDRAFELGAKDGVEASSMNCSYECLRVWCWIVG